MHFYPVLNPSMAYTCLFSQLYFIHFLGHPDMCHSVRVSAPLPINHQNRNSGAFAVVSLMTGVMNQNVMVKYYGKNVTTTIFELEDYSEYPINPIIITSTLAFAVGLFEIAIAALRLDFLCVYFSDPLVGGFTTAAATHILVSQLDDILGFKLPRASGPGYLFGIIFRLISKASEANPWTLAISVATAVILIVGKDWGTPLLNKLSPIKLIIPYELIVVSFTVCLHHTSCRCPESD